MPWVLGNVQSLRWNSHWVQKRGGEFGLRITAEGGRKFRTRVPHNSLRFMPTRHETGLRMTASTMFNYEQIRI